MKRFAREQESGFKMLTDGVIAATTISSSRYLSNSLGNSTSSLENSGENGSSETSYIDAISLAWALICSTSRLICCSREITKNTNLF